MYNFMLNELNDNAYVKKCYKRFSCVKVDVTNLKVVCNRQLI